MPGRILVVRGGAIGDFILTLPAIRLLRENFPRAHLEILGYRHIVALAEGRGYADAARSIEYAPMAGFFVPKSELAPELTEYFSGFHQIVSYLYDPDGFFEANLRRAGAKNILKAYANLDDSDHAARQLARPLQELALFLEDHAPVIHPTPGDFREADAVLNGLDPTRPVVALHPGSGGKRKNWCLENWLALGGFLLEHPARPQLLLVGGEADREELRILEQNWSDDVDVQSARDLPLPALAATLGRCRLFLGHDSGVSHLAAAAGARCILLFGPTDPAVWAPANPSVTIIESPTSDLGDLPLTVVWAAVAGELARRITDA